MQQWTADKNIFQAIIEFFCPGFSDDRRDDRV